MAKDQDKMNNLLTYLLVGLLVVGAYFIGVYKTRSDMLSQGNTPTVAEVQGQQQEQQTELSADDWERVMADPAAVEGDENAPVVMVEFTDFQCPFCKRHYEQTSAQLKEEYIDTGKVRHVVRDLPLSFHANAEDAAVAARCAGESGKYFEMADLLFTNQEEWEGLPDASSTFAEYGDELGINIRSCQTNDSVREAVQSDLALAQEVGATGTPTFFINGKLLVGAVPYAQFQTLIEEEL